MNYVKLFYWITVADNAKAFFIAFIVIFTFIAFISSVGFFLSFDSTNEINQKSARRWMFWSYPFMILFWALYVFTPNKKDALLIVAGGQSLNYLTTDSTARRIPKELTSFVVTELRSMAKDAEVDLFAGKERERVIKAAKDMTTLELINKLRTDSNFAKIIIKE